MTQTGTSPDSKAETSNYTTPGTEKDARPSADTEAAAQASGTQSEGMEASEKDAETSAPPALPAVDEEEDGLPTDPPITEEVSGQVIIGG